MDNNKVYRSTLRLYKDRPIHKEAYACLTERNTEIFRSNDDYIAEAIIHYSRYLKREREAGEVQAFSDFMRDKDNAIFTGFRKIVEEVLDEKMSEMYDKVETTKSTDSKCDDIDSERDAAFADFYDFE